MRAARLTLGVLTIASLTAVPAQAAGHKAPKTPMPHTRSTAAPARPTSAPRLNPIAQKIAAKPNLSSRVGEMLPAGMSLNQASRGFKNQGQFIAALHVSQNLGIPFVDLKRAMTGAHPVPLGQAIKKLRPGANATTTASGAQRQASADLRIDQ